MFIEPAKHIVLFRSNQVQENQKKPRRQFANRGSIFVSLAGISLAAFLVATMNPSDGGQECHREECEVATGLRPNQLVAVG